MENEFSGLLNAIGNVLARDKIYPIDGTYFYTRASSGSVHASIFKDLGDTLVYRDPMPGLSDAVLDLWYAAPEDKKWDLLEYSIENGEFTATFTYPEDMPPDESDYELRLRLVHERFRNKQVIYPPWKHRA